MNGIKLEPECEQCGQCCNTYSFWLTNRSYDNDPKEIKRLIEYHCCEPMKNKRGQLGIKIPMTCIELRLIDGISSCDIHDHKPVVCKEYYCEKIIKKALEKLNGIHV